MEISVAMEKDSLARYEPQRVAYDSSTNRRCKAMPRRVALPELGEK
jgi:hypothetical protein